MDPASNAPHRDSRAARGPGEAHMILRQLFGAARDPKGIDYSKLTAFAAQAARWAEDGVVPTETPEGHHVAIAAGGCFWGDELMFMRLPGVVSTCVGYTAGTSERPTYNEVCSGDGHAEAVMICYDPNVVSYGEILQAYFARVDPTTLNRQGRDVGIQYRSGLYPNTEAQMKVALETIIEEQKKYNKPIVTEVKKATVFWPAEAYHQQYLARGGRFGRPQDARKGATEPIRCYG